MVPCSNGSHRLNKKIKTRKEKCILVVNGTIVSQNQNKRKIEEVQAAINKMIAAASASSASAITSSSIPSSDPSIFWKSAKAHAIFYPKEGPKDEGLFGWLEKSGKGRNLMF
jgi:hypothetical protein